MPVSISGAGSISGLDQGFNVTTGSVGVGTTNPGAKLEVHSDAIPRINTVFQGSKHFGMSVGGSGGGFVLTDGHFMTVNHQTYADRGTDNNLTERLRITSGGNIGVGNADPTQARLVAQIASGVCIAAVKDNTGASISLGGVTQPRVLMEAGASASEFKLYTAGGSSYGSASYVERLRIASDGKLTVIPANTTSSYATTDGGIDIAQIISSTGTSASQSIGIQFNLTKSGETGAIAEIGAIREGSGLSGLVFRTRDNSTGRNERLRITSAGLVGVNCTPLSQFQVKGGTNANIGLTIMGGEAAIEAFNDAGSANVPLRLRASVHKFFIGGTEGLRVHTNGLIGVGHDSPTDYGRMTVAMPSQSGGAAIQVANSSIGSGDGSTSNIVLRSVNNNATQWADAEYRASQHIFSHQGSEKLRITGDGKLCVNTTLSNYGVVQIRDASGDSTTSAIQVENASSGQNLNNVILRSVSLNSGAWAKGEYRAQSHIFSYQTTPVATIQQHGLTIASQPCFWATSNTGGSHTNTGATGIISNQFEAAYVNVGNHFNTSTGVFTCPIAGVYEFHGQGLARQQGSDNNMELTFYKNGSNTMSRAYGYTFVKGSNDHDNLHVMGYITCAANDQIDLRVHALGSGVDCYFAQGLGYFAGRLVQ